MDPRLNAALGVALILLVAIAFSKNRKSINPRIVTSALGLHAAIAFFVFNLEIGQNIISAISAGISSLLGYADAGIGMVFGGLSGDNFGTVFAIHVLPIIIFFSALLAVLYHLRIMPLLVGLVGKGLQYVIGTKPIESMNAAANVAVGMTESPIALKPYLGRLTKPQLFTVMVSGLASVSGSVLAAYAQLGIEIEYLLAASFMSAPSGLLMAKLIFPEETEDASETVTVREIASVKSPYSNSIMAAASGAEDGLKMALNVGAMLIAFVALIAFTNGILGWLGGLFGMDGLSAQMILGWIFSPLMMAISIPAEDASIAGGIFGEKLILNEFVAFISLAAQEDQLAPRSIALLSIALCGFANFGSIAVLLGGMGTLIPERRGEIAEMGPRAVFAGSLANLLSAAFAGVMLAV